MWDFQIFNDIQNVGVKDLFGLYASVNQAKIDKGAAATNNYIAELNAQAELYRAKALSAGTTVNGFAMDNRLVTGLILAAIGYVAYRAIK